MNLEVPSASPKGDLSPLTLAYLGDAVFELLVRERLLQDGVLQRSRLHRRAARLCSAEGQARAAAALLPLLTDEEATLYRRGRNAPLQAAKKRQPALHCAATGLETLFGHLYLQRQTDRLLALFACCYGVLQEEERPPL
ncbi:MAG: Mini-ribonuclease 3 [Clostridiales bacterium]|nr:Mini-ribonuclease 3 [Clostridiales bacterium]